MSSATANSPRLLERRQSRAQARNAAASPYARSASTPRTKPSRMQDDGSGGAQVAGTPLGRAAAASVQQYHTPAKAGLTSSPTALSLASSLGFSAAKSLFSWFSPRRDSSSAPHSKHETERSVDAEDDGQSAGEEEIHVSASQQEHDMHSMDSPSKAPALRKKPSIRSLQIPVSSSSRNLPSPALHQTLSHCNIASSPSSPGLTRSVPRPPRIQVGYGSPVSDSRSPLVSLLVISHNSKRLTRVPAIAVDVDCSISVCAPSAVLPLAINDVRATSSESAQCTLNALSDVWNIDPRLVCPSSALRELRALGCLR